MSIDLCCIADFLFWLKSRKRDGMFRVRTISLFVILVVILLSACAPGSTVMFPPGTTLVPGIDNSQQLPTYVSNALTQTMLPPLTSTTVPGAATLSPGNGATTTSIPRIGSSLQPLPSGKLKPAESDTPASGTCSEAQDDPVSIVLGMDPSGLPMAGRCIKINPSQRIKLINQSNGPINMLFGEYHIDLPVGSEILLDKPAGQYLALGVHFLNLGPELWVKDGFATTVPPPIVEYNNSVDGYSFNLPGNWVINETNGSNKEVIFSPPNAEPFISYLSISLESRTLNQIILSYTEYYPDAVRDDTIFYGYPALKYIFPGGRNEYFIPYGNQLTLVSTDRPNDGIVQSILMTIRFTSPPQPVTYDASLTDNGRTFYMNIGDKLRLNLDYGYIWSMISISDPAVLAGAGDGYFAFTSGTTTLTTIGNPECINSTPPCLMPSIVFALTVIVR